MATSENLGNQVIVNDFRQRLSSSELGREFEAIGEGIIDGLDIIIAGDTQIVINPGSCIIRDRVKAGIYFYVKFQNNFVMNVENTEATANPNRLLYLEYERRNSINNYAKFTFSAPGNLTVPTYAIPIVNIGFSTDGNIASLFYAERNKYSSYFKSREAFNFLDSIVRDDNRVNTENDITDLYVTRPNKLPYLESYVTRNTRKGDLTARISKGTGTAVATINENSFIEYNNNYRVLNSNDVTNFENTIGNIDHEVGSTGPYRLSGFAPNSWYSFNVIFGSEGGFRNPHDVRFTASVLPGEELNTDIVNRFFSIGEEINSNMPITIDLSLLPNITPTNLNGAFLEITTNELTPIRGFYEIRTVNYSAAGTSVLGVRAPGVLNSNLHTPFIGFTNTGIKIYYKIGTTPVTSQTNLKENDYIGLTPKLNYNQDRKAYTPLQDIRNPVNTDEFLSGDNFRTIGIGLSNGTNTGFEYIYSLGNNREWAGLESFEPGHVFLSLDEREHPGTFICDGREIITDGTTSDPYFRLKQYLGNKFGTPMNPANTNHFKLPDMAGYFPRFYENTTNDPVRDDIINGQARRRPDSTEAEGSETSESNVVGGIEQDQFQGFRILNTVNSIARGDGVTATSSGGIQSGTNRRLLSAGEQGYFRDIGIVNNGFPRYGNETRPKNMAFLPLIKY